MTKKNAWQSAGNIKDIYVNWLIYPATKAVIL